MIVRHVAIKHLFNFSDRRSFIREFLFFAVSHAGRRQPLSRRRNNFQVMKRAAITSKPCKTTGCVRLLFISSHHTRDNIFKQHCTFLLATDAGHHVIKSYQVSAFCITMTIAQQAAGAGQSWMRPPTGVSPYRHWPSRFSVDVPSGAAGEIRLDCVFLILWYRDRYMNVFGARQQATLGDEIIRHAFRWCAAAIHPWAPDSVTIRQANAFVE